MEQQVKAEAQTKAMLDAAGIIPASQRRAQEVLQRDYYLGPQLQVAWEEDRLIKPNLDYDSGNESPTEEVLKLLKKRNNEQPLPKVSETSEAFLKSSYSGALTTKPATIQMNQVSKTDIRKIGGEKELSEEEKNRGYLPTQLHQDWGSNIESSSNYKGKVIQMDIIPGRETKKVIQKGVYETIPFDQAPRVRYDEVGPGEYDIDIGRRLGENIPTGMIDFNRYVSRNDMIGPNGEKPENEKEFENIQDDYFLQKEEVITDGIKSKEKLLKRVQTPTLYIKVIIYLFINLLKLLYLNFYSI